MGRPSKVRVTGPLEPFADGFRHELVRLGYRSNAACSQLQLMAHLSQWMDSSTVAVSGLTPTHLDEFLVHRRGEGYTLWLSPKALAPLLAYLRQLDVVLVVTATGPVSEIDRLLADYESFLVSERGLAEGTIVGYVYVARLFLAARVAAAGDDVALGALTAEQVTGFVLSECAARSVGSAKFVVCGLRSMLRWAYVVGLVDAELDAAVPSVSGWRLTGVPVSFGPGEVARLLASCDRRSKFGRRDYAVLCLLSRLGLRSIRWRRSSWATLIGGRERILGENMGDNRIERWIMVADLPQVANECWAEFVPGIDPAVASDVLRAKAGSQGPDLIVRHVGSGADELVRVAIEGRIGRSMSVGLGCLVGLAIMAIRLLRRRELAIYRLVGSSRMEVATIEIISVTNLVSIGGLSAFPTAVLSHQLLIGTRHSQQVLEATYRSCLVVVLVAVLLGALASLGIPTRNLLESVRD